MTIIGIKRKISNPSEVSDQYAAMALQDENAAMELQKSGFYNQSGYFYIQAMEKYIKCHITRKIDAMNPYFAEKISRSLGHSLNESVALLVDVYAGNNTSMAEQMNQQISTNILKEINFRSLHNMLRYPTYSSHFGNYTTLALTNKECVTLKNVLNTLKSYLNDLHKL